MTTYPLPVSSNAFIVLDFFPEFCTIILQYVMEISKPNVKLSPSPKLPFISLLNILAQAAASVIG
jgi:hypothetical protein